MFITGIMIAAPYTQYIFNSKNYYRYCVKYVKEIIVFFMNWLYGFHHHCNHVQYDQDDNKPIDDFIPPGITQLRMKQYVNLMFGGMIHTW